MTEKISTGSYDLNKWLFGGYESDIITMIAGPPGSGKTNFAILAACSQSRHGKKVIFIDTEGGFSVERVKQIVGEKSEEILENILLLGPTNFEEQREVFEKLLDKIKKEHVGLIIVDSMAMLYRLELGDAIQLKEDNKVKDINREVAMQMRMLAEVARKQKIPIIITNQVYGDFLCEEDFRNGVERKMNIVGGDLFKYWCKCIIELKNDKIRRAILLKHRNLPEKEIGFVIKNEGIFKRGIF
jgi:DNA repair protein RadB